MVYPVINLPLLQHFSCSEIINSHLINQYDIGTPKNLSVHNHAPGKNKAKQLLFLTLHKTECS